MLLPTSGAAAEFTLCEETSERLAAADRVAQVKAALKRSLDAGPGLGDDGVGEDDDG